MNPPDDAQSAASRLCGHCGMCCNGVMFHTVWLQPGESAGRLMSLGLKLKFKKKQHYLLQPCAAYKDSQCAIYEERPTRCRLFECQQLKRVAKGEITEATALEKIEEVKRRVAVITDLLARSGPTDPTRPLSRRCDHIAAEPVDPTDAPAVELRLHLTRAMEELEALLDADFRNPK